MIFTFQIALISNSSVFCFLYEITIAVINNLGFEKGAVWICKGNFSIIYAQSKIVREILWEKMLDKSSQPGDFKFSFPLKWTGCPTYRGALGLHPLSLGASLSRLNAAPVKREGTGGRSEGWGWRFPELNVEAGMSCVAANPLLSVLHGCTFTTEQHSTWPRDSSCQNSNYDTLKSTLRSSEGLGFYTPEY